MKKNNILTRISWTLRKDRTDRKIETEVLKRRKSDGERKEKERGRKKWQISVRKEEDKRFFHL